MAPPKHNFCILLVEDDPAVASMLQDLLDAEGYYVDICRDGKSVLQTLAHKTYGLLILDVLLPHVSGFGLVKLIRGEPEWLDLPIILMSGIYRSRNHRNVVTDFYVLDYFDKPLNTARLVDVAKKTLGTPSVKGVRPRRPDPAAQAPTVKTTTPAPTDLLDAEANNERRQVEEDARSQFKAGPFLLQGSLKQTPVPPLLGKLWHGDANGALLLRSAGMKKILYLRRGSPYGVKSNLVNECLGQVLVQERLINHEQCRQSIELMKSSGKRQGEVLVDIMHCITPQNLRFSLQLQMEIKLFNAFSWEHGEYRFNPSVPLVETVVTMSMRSPALVVEGVRRTLSETFMRSRLMPVLDVALRLRKHNTDFSALGFSAKEMLAFSAASLPATSRHLLETLPLAPADTLRVLYCLIALELLVPIAVVDP